MDGQALSQDLRGEITRIVESVPVDFGGGCSLRKALVLAEVIIRNDLSDVLEIGVYRGRGLFPLAAALRSTGRGTATGVDPWSKDAAVQNEAHALAPGVREWALAQPWDQTYEDVVRRRQELDLEAHCRLLRRTAVDAAPLFKSGSLDLVHIDGNHDRPAVQRDVDNYLPKLRPGGFVVMDDVSWASIRPVMLELVDRNRLVFQLSDFLGYEQSSDFAIIQI
jgi:predicted O-methyltransferase YrrM